MACFLEVVSRRLFLPHSAIFEEDFRRMAGLEVWCGEVGAVNKI